MSCADCQQFVYDMKTGKRETYQCGTPDNIQPMLRHGAPPPCKLGETCPKISPEHEKEVTLNLRNSLLHSVYLETRAAGPPAEPHDGLCRRMLAICDLAYRTQDRIDSLRQMGLLGSVV